MVIAYSKASIPDALASLFNPEASTQVVAFEVDARELSCPLPLLKAKQGLRNLAAGEVLRVLATDAGSLKDFVSFSQLTGQALVGFHQRDDVYCYLIRKQ